MNNRLHNSTETFSVFYEETVTILFIEKSSSAVKLAFCTIDRVIFCYSTQLHNGILRHINRT
jgi:hypothetical protein